MLFTSSTSCPRTERLTRQTAARLQASAYTERYKECGWACITGFDARHRVTVMVNADSDDEIDLALGLKEPASPYGDY